MNIILQPRIAFEYAALASTNAAAIAHLNDGEFPDPGAVYLTEAQTAGRGQAGNTWHATPGDNLTLSMVAYPDHLAVGRLFVLNQYVSLAVADTVRAFLPPPLAARVRVKWPNDVYVGDRKIAGILIQNGLRGSQISWSVIGVGLNVNERAFPAELIPTATSLALLCDGAVDKRAVRQRLFIHLAEHYPLTTAANLATLRGRYRRMQYRLEEPGRFHVVASGETFTGIILGVTDGGQLRIAATGGERLFSLREVRYGERL